MSDRPLFQDSDEQEARYTPQQLPEGAPGERTAEIEGDQRSSETDADVVIVPGAAAAGANFDATGPALGAGSLSGVAPVANDETIDDTPDRNDDR